MRVLRHFALIASTLLVLLMGATPAAHAATSTTIQDDPRCPTTHRTPSTIPPPTVTTQKYFLNDWRLGPQKLPKEPPIGPMLFGYKRLDAMTPEEFISCFWNPVTSGWWFPDNNGFVLVGDKPLEAAVKLFVGQKVDLFGTGTGGFLAPAGANYTTRALPPSNLDTLNEDFPFGYHLYTVKKSFMVDAGPIRPWFGQPGLGLQYVLNAQYIPGAPNPLKIPYLLANGYLEELTAAPQHP